ncbi:MAG: precorrin-3B C(17)-methyltransferase [Pseudomonas sp.]|uniref:precorrin-3B C(17)-methyltransferase n=1 Tax=Pseudomonas sp. TaxID=306 RepID=UPI00339A6E23
MADLLPPAIVILGPSALATARRVQALYPQASLHRQRGRISDADDPYGEPYDDFGSLLRTLYREGRPLLVLCAAGIVIRCLAPLLAEKGNEPPVLALAEDGSAVVPLLGGLAGVNRLAREIAAALQVSPAITTSGELRFGTCLLDPPAGYVLADLEQGKHFVSDLLGGEPLRIEGHAPWLDGAELPVDNLAQRVIHISPHPRPPSANELLIYPQRVAALIDRPGPQLHHDLLAALDDAGLAPQALACLMADPRWMADANLQRTAAQLNVPLRFIEHEQHLPAVHRSFAHLRLLLAEAPIDPAHIGRPRGSLTVVGLGPGAAEFRVPAASLALQQAEDVLGYETYVIMAGPFRTDQCLHHSDNREELQRAQHAFELAASGRRVVVVSSGDPGVFAMAAAVLEALEGSADPRWHGVELQVFPGVSAALACAARAGAPLGHDFCVLSLSDNLKPWTVIEDRLRHAADADLAMAFYNPISKARPWQLGRALEILRERRDGDTLVVLGRDIGRPAERLSLTSLAALTPEQVDMRTLVIIGSSTTRQFPRADGGAWVYTPRSYP